MRVILASCLAVATLAAAAPSLAQGTTVEELTVTGRPKALPETMTYRITYADVDLATPEGQKELDRRVRVAADYICGQMNSGLDVGTCTTNAVRDAHRQYDRARKTQPHPFHAGAGWIPPPGKQ